MYKKIMVIVLFLLVNRIYSQNGSISGVVSSNGHPIPYVNVYLANSSLGSTTDEKGFYTISNIHTGSYELRCSDIEYKMQVKAFSIKKGEHLKEDFILKPINEDLDEVVVTGTSHATKIRNNPIPIIGISQKLIKETISDNVIDAIVKNTTGLSVLKTGPNVSKPFIRGLGYNNVLTLYDGLRQEEQQWGDEHGLEIDDYIIKKAEVVKGPASLMYGSGAIAGVLNLIPFKPTSKDSILNVNLLTEYQSNNHLLGTSVRIQKYHKKWVYGLTLSRRIATNYKNKIDGYVYLTGFKTTNLSAMLGKHYKNGKFNLNATVYNNLQGIPDGSRDSITRKFTKQIYDGDLDDIKNRPFANKKELKSYKLSPLHQHVQDFRVYVKNNLYLGNGSLKTLFGYQQNIRREFIHPTVPLQAGSFMRLSTLNYSIDYSSSNHKSISFSLGSNGMIQNNKDKDATEFPIPNYTSYDIGQYITAHLKKERLNIYAGVRFDIRSIKVGSLYTQLDQLTGFEKQIKIPTSSSKQIYHKIDKFYKGFTGNFGMTYQLSKALSVKANIGRGYRAPSINEIAAKGLNPGAHIYYIGNENFKSEFNLQEDFGIIYNYNKVIKSSLSIYNNTITNYTYLIQDLDKSGNPIEIIPNNLTYKFVQAKAQINGVEASLNIMPKNFMGLSFNNQFAVVYGYNRDSKNKHKGVNGEYLTFIAPLNWNSQITKKFNGKFGRISDLSAHFGLSKHGAQNRYRADTETATKGYTLFNTGINFNVDVNTKSPLKVYLRANNLFNTIWQSNMGRLKYFEYYKQSPNGYLGINGMGSNFSIKVIWQI